jgi:predicted HD phosphohydrolase
MDAMAECPPNLTGIIDLLQRADTMEEPNEEIRGLTVLHHGLQCADHLSRTCADDPELLAAGLLHDVGHLLAPGREELHGTVGAAFVRPVLGDRVAVLIEAHVPAKRYLVTTDLSYRERLSEGSIRTLMIQGQDMTDDELMAFRASPYAEAALALRRADEESKDPAAPVPDLASWLPTLITVAG